MLIVEAKTEEERLSEQPPADPLALAQAYMKEGLSVNEAAKRAAKETGAKKSDIYRLLTEKS